MSHILSRLGLRAQEEEVWQHLCRNRLDLHSIPERSSQLVRISQDFHSPRNNGEFHVLYTSCISLSQL